MKTEDAPKTETLPAIKPETRSTITAAEMHARAAAAAALKPATIREQLEGPAFFNAVAKALPRHLKPDRFIRIALTAITRTPKLKDCDRHSFFNCLLTLSQLGIEPDGRRAHLIPFENHRKKITECQLIIDWKGLSELVYRSGIVSTLHADVVRSGDIFIYSMGVLESHVPHFLRTDAAKPDEPGEVFCAYATAQMKDGARKTEVLSMADLGKIRDGSQGYRAAIKYNNTDHPWIKWESEMQKKTAFRRLSKWLPLSPEIRDAIEAEDAVDVQASVVTEFSPRKGMAELMQPAGATDDDIFGDDPAEQGGAS